MRLRRLCLIVAIAPTILLCADVSPRAQQVGDAHEIILTRESAQQASDGTTGSSRDRNTVIERVIAVRPDGFELEYDLPASAGAEERSRTWQFPARIFKKSDASAQLLNASKLEVRLDAWLKAANWTRDVCGRLFFTWTAFRVECDPQSVMGSIAVFDMRVENLREGERYRDPQAREPGILVKKSAKAGGVVFTTELLIDPDVVHRERAQADVGVGEILKKPVTLEAALRARSKEIVSGTISVMFEADNVGNPLRRTIVTKLTIEAPGGRSEAMTVTEKLERRRVSQRQ